ncbi:hypothetical protein GFH31_03220 [Alistipes sp. dk3624]|uniref:hypothetical protein n=1 Tax=Alistipes sp. dk3624 TaxID=2662363 RepID=UPI0012961DF7|nr:hypothetical protein [Alistipes sp. dk3624]QGA22925.1 hypothetical protein GFH31_03220 [Alistipes sp. dk3624]
MKNPVNQRFIGFSFSGTKRKGAILHTDFQPYSGVIQNRPKSAPDLALTHYYAMFCLLTSQLWSNNFVSLKISSYEKTNIRHSVLY